VHIKKVELTILVIIPLILAVVLKGVEVVINELLLVVVMSLYQVKEEL
jgi:hypothetical protein